MIFLHYIVKIIVVISSAVNLGQRWQTQTGRLAVKHCNNSLQWILNPKCIESILHLRQLSSR